MPARVDKVNKIPKKKLKVIIPLAVIGGVLVLGGLIALIVYLAQLGKVSQCGSCMGDASCLNGSSLYCLNGVCSCNTTMTWNSTSSKCGNYIIHVGNSSNFE